MKCYPLLLKMQLVYSSLTSTVHPSHALGQLSSSSPRTEGDEYKRKNVTQQSRCLVRWLMDKKFKVKLEICKTNDKDNLDVAWISLLPAT